MACGDLMYNHLELFPEYERAVKEMGVPFFQVIGNHDMDFTAAGDAHSGDTFSRHFGPRYYSFDRGAVHYVVLDDVFWHGSGYIGYLDDDQLTWLAGDLARVEAMVEACFRSEDYREGQRAFAEKRPPSFTGR